MMADPAFKAQAKAAMANMQASGSMPDIGKLMNNPQVMAKAKAMAQAMYGGGAAGGDSTAAEIARLRAENAALKSGGFA